MGQRSTSRQVPRRPLTRSHHLARSGAGAAETQDGGYKRAIAAGLVCPDDALVIKRTAASILWFLAAWTFGALVAFAAGLPGWLAPLLAVSAAILIASDTLGLFWQATPTQTSAKAPAVERRLA